MSGLRVVGGSVVIGTEWREADVVVEGRQIERVESRRTSDVSRRQDEVTLDASGCSVLPGFVDLQVNGAVGVDLTTEPERLAEVASFLPRCGVTSFLPTLVSSSPADTQRATEVMHELGRAHPRGGARSLGVHLEGPFLNPARAGAHAPEHLRRPSRAEVATWRDKGVALVTLAPELPGAVDVIRDLVEAGVVVCAGHTEVDAEGLAAAVSAGLTGVTHLFNGMGTMSARHPGAAGEVLAQPSLIAGLIVDGSHVDPTMVRIAWSVLGADRIALVTDAMAGLGLPHGSTRIGTMEVRVDEHGARTTSGALAGSVLSFDAAVRNLIEFTGATLAEVSRAASTTPARLLGRAEIGRVASGAVADLVLLDAGLRVVATVVSGQVVWDPQHRSSAVALGEFSWKS